MSNKRLISKQREFTNPNGEYGYVRVEYDPLKELLICTVKKKVPNCHIPENEVKEAIEDLLDTGIEGVSIQLTPKEVDELFEKSKK